ncbi:MAG: family 43 glycosylhydrolase [Candidatus Krumholzibacteriota bacterium]|nr:family 43 glycosylhydrolase [Candidatus Krumholzibacteriota bacterium]
MKKPRGKNRSNSFFGPKEQPYGGSLSISIVLLFLITPLFAPEAAAADELFLEDPEITFSKEVRPVGLTPMARFDFEGPVFIEEGKLIKDHSFIKVGNMFHLFYITDLEKSFGHAVSPDLRHWEILDRVLTAEPDAHKIWAPCVVPFEDYPGYHLIYYTFVNSHMAQSTNLAFSTLDLTVWTKADSGFFEPYHPDTSWAAWNENSWSNCRDPWFFTDDNDSNYIINTAWTKDGIGAISLASSDGYFDFKDIGPLYVHNSWHVLESTFLLKRAGKYHLFFTEEGVGGISHMSAPTLVGNWDITNRVIIDSGAACEQIRLSDHASLFSRHTSYLISPTEILYSIRIDTMTWNGNDPKINIEDPLSRDWTILWGTAFNRQPVFGNNYHYRGDDSTVAGFEGNWWIGTSEAFDGPLLGSMPGARQGDLPTGAIRSKRFIIAGRSMRMLVGGGDFPGECYIAMTRAADGTILFSETGKGTEQMDRRVWDLDRYIGEEVYIEIIDNSSEPMGHINVDSIEESPLPAIFPRDDAGEESEKPGETRDRILSDETNLYMKIPSARHSVGCSPNPFNPVTKIEFCGDISCAYTIRIFDMAGRSIDSFKVETDSSGRGHYYWNGTDSGGRQVAAGIYAGAVCSRSRILAVCKLVLIR